MHHTHGPFENENFPSAKPPARTIFSHFFLLSDIFATFFAIFILLFKSLNRLFSRLPGSPRLSIAESDSFFLFSFLRQKNLISGESPETRFLVVLWYFCFLFSAFLFVLLALCFDIFTVFHYPSETGKRQKKSQKKWQKNLHVNIE